MSIPLSLFLVHYESKKSLLITDALNRSVKREQYSLDSASEYDLFKSIHERR